MSGATSETPLVVHVIYRLAIGGMENGLVNLINHMPAERYRHAIVCIDDFTDFRARLQRDDVEVYALHKKPGHDLGVYWRFWKLMRRLKPSIVHTRNLNALEFQLPAWLAGVPRRVQSEHGRTTTDLKGDNPAYLRLRQIVNPFVHWHIALSRDLYDWLLKSVKLPAQRISQIYNGVDIRRFVPVRSREDIPLANLVNVESIVIGTIGRMSAEKDQLTLVRAFVQLIDSVEHGRDKLRLIVIGDGPLRAQAYEILQQAKAEMLAWLPGNRDDASQCFQAMDIFVLPSLIEGISNTILEAMASGLPVVATNVGGNPELVDEGVTGKLIPSADANSMAAAIKTYIDDPEMRRTHGAAGRRRVEQHFSMESMVDGYLDVYDHLTQGSATINKHKPISIKESVED